MNNRALAFVLLLSLSLLGGCAANQANTTTKAELFPLMYEQKPRSIVVLPPINESTAADAPTYYSTTIQEPLVFTGYYVLPYEVSSDVLAHEGITDGHQLYELPLNTLKDFFGADAALFTRIKKWDTSYMVLASYLTVAVECELKSTTTGERLWNYSGTVVIDLGGGNAGGGLAGLVASAIVTAINTAAADYVPYAKMANYMALGAMPYGPYHPHHEQDSEQKVFRQDGANK